MIFLLHMQSVFWFLIWKLGESLISCSVGNPAFIQGRPISESLLIPLLLGSGTLHFQEHCFQQVFSHRCSETTRDVLPCSGTIQLLQMCVLPA
jgi:hypothetical protein